MRTRDLMICCRCHPNRSPPVRPYPLHNFAANDLLHPASANLAAGRRLRSPSWRRDRRDTRARRRDLADSGSTSRIRFSRPGRLLGPRSLGWAVRIEPAGRADQVVQARPPRAVSQRGECPPEPVPALRQARRRRRPMAVSGYPNQFAIDVTTIGMISGRFQSAVRRCRNSPRAIYPGGRRSPVALPHRGG